MKNSTIATLLLVGIPLIITLIKIPEILYAFTFLALLFGFCFIIISPVFGGWYIFFAILWEMIWATIAIFFPTQRKIWTS